MIRKADENDLPRLAQLFSELHGHHCRIFPEAHVMPESGYFEKAVSELLADGENTVLVIESAEIDGYAVMRFIDVNSETKPREKVCFIDCFAVSEKCRRSGVGTALFEGVCDLARENGCNAVRLGVNAKNESARRFYEKMGLAPRNIIMNKNL